MKIAVYFSPLRGTVKPSGVGRHVVNMVSEMVAAPNVAPSLVTTRAEYECVKGDLPVSLAGVEVDYLPGNERMMRALLLGTPLVSVERWTRPADWVYCPKEQPVTTRKARLAVTVHDVMAFEARVQGIPNHWARRKACIRWRLVMRNVLKRADLIATVSGFTKQRIVELFGMKYDERIVVVGNGVSEKFFHVPSDEERVEPELLRALGLCDRPYFVAVGSLTWRKGGDVLLGLAQLLSREKRSVRILVVGKRHDRDLHRQYMAMKSADERLGIELLGYVTDTALATLLRRSVGLLFPSRYEGFGIPVLEAMAAGAPVVTSAFPALQEVAGAACVCVDSDDPADWLDVVVELECNSRRRVELRRLGKARAAEFTWAACGERLISALAQ